MDECSVKNAPKTGSADSRRPRMLGGVMGKTERGEIRLLSFLGTYRNLEVSVWKRQKFSKKSFEVFISCTLENLPEVANNI